MTTRAKEPDLSDFVTTGEVAEMYQVDQREVQRAIKRGAIKAQRVGYFYLIWKPSLPETFPHAD